MGRPTTGMESISPRKQRAVAMKNYGEVIIRDDAQCPTLPTDHVYVRVDAVALNPSETKMRGAFATP
jgi:NADPH:quinone reductase-like Zn-dependent oxidoreductase